MALHLDDPLADLPEFRETFDEITRLKNRLKPEDVNRVQEDLLRMFDLGWRISWLAALVFVKDLDKTPEGKVYLLQLESLQEALKLLCTSEK